MKIPINLCVNCVNKEHSGDQRLVAEQFSCFQCLALHGCMTSCKLCINSNKNISAPGRKLVGLLY